MEAEARCTESSMGSHRTRWYPSSLLDLPPLEPVFALRTPHRISFQAMPSSRDVLAKLLNSPFDISIEIDSEEAPLQHVPVQDVHEARLTPDLPLDWEHYYWLADGLLDDLHAFCNEPARALAWGRQRLRIAENTFRAHRRGVPVSLASVVEAWEEHCQSGFTEPERTLESLQTLQQYVRGITGHLVEHASSRAFVDWAADLLMESEKNPGRNLPHLAETENRLLGQYLQHRLFGSGWLTAPSGMIAGWHSLVSAYVLSVWYADLLLSAGYEKYFEEALFGSLWMLDQGFWRDEPLVHNVLHNLNASQYTTPELAQALTTAMRPASQQA